MFCQIYPQTRASSGMGMDSSRTAWGLPIPTPIVVGTILPSDRSHLPPPHHRCRRRANAALSLTKPLSASGPGVCVVAVLPIPAGEEVTISYATGPSLSPGGGEWAAGTNGPRLSVQDFYPRGMWVYSLCGCTLIC